MKNCLFSWCKGVAWRTDVPVERGQTIADIEITLDLFTSWHLTEADLTSFRLIVVTK